LSKQVFDQPFAEGKEASMRITRNDKKSMYGAFPRGARYALLLPVIFALAGCMPGQDLTMLPSPEDGSYHLGPGDQIRVITYDESQLSNTFTVGDDGKIAFPLIGNVVASGRTPDRFASEISAALQNSKLVNQPSVSVEVVQYRPISVLGEVNHPGQYPYQPGMTTLDAVALAGGFTYRAVTGYAEDWRTAGHGSADAIKGKVGPSSGLEPGDVITVFERYF
jgi:polysaccharide export outer membrane protein